MGVAADPAFAGAPQGRTPVQAGLRFAVYRVEVTPSAATVWWELTGPGAGDAAARLKPLLLPDGNGVFLEPQSTALGASGQTRAVGVSAYRAFLTGETAGVVRVCELGGALADWAVSVPMERRGFLTAEREIPVNRVLGPR